MWPKREARKDRESKKERDQKQAAKLKKQSLA